MAVEFYCKVSGAIIGPFSNNHLIAMASNGKLTPEDFIRTSNSSTWIKANKISGLVFNNSKIDQAETESIKKEPSKIQSTRVYNLKTSKTSYLFLKILSNMYMGFGFLILTLIPLVLVYLLILHGGISNSIKNNNMVFEILIFIGGGSFSGVMMLAIGQSIKLAVNTADNIQLLTQSFVKSLNQPKDED